MHPLLENFGLYAIDNGMVGAIAFEDRGDGRRVEGRKHVIGIYYLPGEELHVVALGYVVSEGNGHRVIPVKPGTFEEHDEAAIVVPNLDRAVDWLQDHFRDQIEALTLQAGPFLAEA